MLWQAAVAVRMLLQAPVTVVLVVAMQVKRAGPTVALAVRVGLVHWVLPPVQVDLRTEVIRRDSLGMMGTEAMVAPAMAEPHRRGQVAGAGEMVGIPELSLETVAAVAVVPDSLAAAAAAAVAGVWVVAAVVLSPTLVLAPDGSFLGQKRRLVTSLMPTTLGAELLGSTGAL